MEFWVDRKKLAACLKKIKTMCPTDEVTLVIEAQSNNNLVFECLLESSHSYYEIVVSDISYVNSPGRVEIIENIKYLSGFLKDMLDKDWIRVKDEDECSLFFDNFKFNKVDKLEIPEAPEIIKNTKTNSPDLVSIDPEYLYKVFNSHQHLILNKKNKLFKMTHSFLRLNENGVDIISTDSHIAGHTKLYKAAIPSGFKNAEVLIPYKHIKIIIKFLYKEKRRVSFGVSSDYCILFQIDSEKLILSPINQEATYVDNYPLSFLEEEIGFEKNKDAELSVDYDKFNKTLQNYVKFNKSNVFRSLERPNSIICFNFESQKAKLKKMELKYIPIADYSSSPEPIIIDILSGVHYWNSEDLDTKFKIRFLVGLIIKFLKCVSVWKSKTITIKFGFVKRAPVLFEIDDISLLLTQCKKVSYE